VHKNLNATDHHALVYALTLFFCNTTLLLLFITATHPLEKGVWSALHLVITLLSIISSYKHVRFLLHLSVQSSPLEQNLDLLLFFISIIVIFNGFFLFVDPASFLEKQLLMGICILPFYLFSLYLTCHLLISHKGRGSPALVSYLFTVMIFTLVSAIFLFTIAANLFLNLSHLFLAFCFLQMNS